MVLSREQQICYGGCGSLAYDVALTQADVCVGGAKLYNVVASYFNRVQPFVRAQFFADQ